MAIGARSQSARTYLEKHLDKFPDSKYNTCLFMKKSYTCQTVLNTHISFACPILFNVVQDISKALLLIWNILTPGSGPWLEPGLSN